METTFTWLDMEQYPRREHFAYFLGYANPYVGITCEVDITAFLARVRADARPFFLTLLWHAARAANAVPQLRQRIVDGRIAEYALCPTSHTVAKPDGTYAYCSLDAGMPLARFLPYASARQEAAKTRGSIVETASDTLPLLFVSSVPWLSYSAMVQPTPSPADSNPRITWGRHHTENGRTLLPVSILCHHALVDGRHIAGFYDALTQSLDTPE